MEGGTQSGAAPPDAPGPGETLDSICGGVVRLLQRQSGYRFALDPVLLAHFAASAPLRGKVMDLGTGSGIIPLILARKFGLSGLVGLELQPSLFELAARNVRLNGCEARVSVALGDLRRVEALFARGSFAHVLANPPYCARRSGRTNPDPEKAHARHELSCSLDEVIWAASWLLRDGGMLHVVFPAPRLTGLITALLRERLSPRRLRLVHSRQGRPAQRVLLTAVKGAAADLLVAPPLVLHPDAGPGFTGEVRWMVESSSGRPARLAGAAAQEGSQEV